MYIYIVISYSYICVCTYTCMYVYYVYMCVFSVVTPDLKSSLVKVLGLLRDAAESYSKVPERLVALTFDLYLMTFDF